MDYIWVAQEIWRKRIGLIKMLVFQGALVSKGLKEYPDKEDEMLTCVSYLLGYLAVLAAKCVEVINKVSEETIHNDLLVNQLTFHDLNKS